MVSRRSLALLCSLLASPALARQAPPATSLENADAKAAPAAAAPASSSDKIILGSGSHKYEWIRNWLKLPAGMKELGPTHGSIVCDSQNHLYVSTDTENAVVMLDQDGNWLGAWGKELGGGLHGMTLRKEGGEEFIYAAHLSKNEVVKLSLDGKVIWSVGYPEKSGVYKSASDYHPTGIAVLMDGSFVVADGYGTSWLHLYDKKQNYVKSFGGPGTELGKFQTCHGLCVDTRGPQPTLLIADRESHRLQQFDLDGKPIKLFDRELRRPCMTSTTYGDGDVVVADLAGRVTIFDAGMKLVCHLGDNPDPNLRAQFNVPVEKWKDGEFLSPHGAAWDRDGNLYVEDWNEHGRVTKLQRIRG